jgi:hypothetical protein
VHFPRDSWYSLFRCSLEKQKQNNYCFLGVGSHPSTAVFSPMGCGKPLFPLLFGLSSEIKKLEMYVFLKLVKF